MLFDIFFIVYFRERTKEVIAEIDKEIAKLKMRKVITVWKILILFKYFRLKGYGTGHEIVVKVCKIMVFSEIDAKVKKLRKRRAKVNNNLIVI